MKKVDFFKHSVGEDEKRSVVTALDSEFLTTGGFVNSFEEKFSAHIGMQHTVGLTSCTAALHLALLSCGIGHGDEVITTPMTFAATSLAIIHAGAIPVWVDVEPDTGNLDVDKIEKHITKRTRAILPVHLYGQMCDMLAIRQIADKYNLRVIEDAAHALVSSRGIIRVGHLSDVCCFSFYTTKSITCGEGGAATTNYVSLYNRMRCLRSHGMSSDAASRHSGKYKHWDLEELGWKYNMDNIKASILIPQIAKSVAFRSMRERCFTQYMHRLSNCSKLAFPKIRPESKSDYHLFTVWVNPEKRDSILHFMQENGVGVTVNYRSINKLTALSIPNYPHGSLENSERIGESTISLPLYPSLSEEDIDYVSNTLLKAIEKC